MKKCVQCGGSELEHVKTDHPYMKGSGLHITLKDVDAHRCLQCGEVYLALKNTDELDRMLVRHVISQARRLTGGEFRFLRKMLGWSAKELAEYFQTPNTTVSKWENNTQKPSPPVELLIRLLAAEEVGLKFTIETAPKLLDPGKDFAEPRVHATMHDRQWVAA